MPDILSLNQALKLEPIAFPGVQRLRNGTVTMVASAAVLRKDDACP